MNSYVRPLVDVDFSETLDRCITSWRGKGLRLGDPIAPHTIVDAWKTFGHKLSSDVVKLYTTIGGFADYDQWDGNFWNLWPWDHLIERNREDPYASGVVFCDHSLEVCTWVLKYESPSTSSVWLGDVYETAPSLAAFFQRYLTDPKIDLWSV